MYVLYGKQPVQSIWTNLQLSGVESSIRIYLQRPVYRSHQSQAPCMHLAWNQYVFPVGNLIILLQALRHIPVDQSTQLHHGGLFVPKERQLHQKPL
jgi:hypothetical protein